MSLSQHDRQVLADIEQHLTEHDPRLARMLSCFDRTTPLRTVLPRLLRRGHGIPLITIAFLVLAVSLLGVAIALRSPAVLIAAGTMACVSALPKLTGFGRRSDRRGRSGRRCRKGRRD